MMDTKHFKILAGAALISFTLAGIVHGAYDAWTPEKVEGEKLLADFDRYADNIAKVRLQKAETILTLTKGKDGGWALSERGGYLVKPKKVRQLLGQIATAELVEAKTRDPERYDLLELGDPSEKSATATLIKLSDADGDVLSELVVGKQRFSAFGSGRSGSYIRRSGNPQTWLANVAIQVPLDVPDWVEPVFFKLPSNKVLSIELTPPDGAPVQIALEKEPAKPRSQTGKPQQAQDKPAQDKVTDNNDGTTDVAKKKEPKFRFSAIPEGKALKSGVDATAMVKVLETLELTDVRKAGSASGKDDGSGNNERLTARLETVDAMVLDIVVSRRGDGERWLTIAVTADGKDAGIAGATKAGVEGWEFKIPAWRSDQIFKTSAEMFEEKVDETKADNGALPTKDQKSTETDQKVLPSEP